MYIVQDCFYILRWYEKLLLTGERMFTTMKIYSIEKMREKRFDQWNKRKKNTDSLIKRPYFSEREIWWVYLGQNIASEAIGKGKEFLRPVVIFKKVYGNSALAIPLTSQIRKGSYYYSFIDTKNTSQCALLTQIRYIDGKRLKYKTSTMYKKDFFNLINRFIDILKNNPDVTSGDPNLG